jgi:hypothetical protein
VTATVLAIILAFLGLLGTIAKWYFGSRAKTREELKRESIDKAAQDEKDAVNRWLN